MKLTVSNIDWDYDDQNDVTGLPVKLTIDDPILLPHLLVDINGEAENLADYLSNTYGYCVRGFATQVEGVDVS